MKDNLYDVLIIGSGIAGLTTALSIDSRYSVVVCSKTALDDGATNLAQGGVAAVVSDNDTVENHIKDTILAGDGHNDAAAVTLLSKESKQAITWLQSQGVPFDKNSEGDYDTHLEGAHSHSRVVHSSDFTGKYIEAALLAQCRTKKNITLLENYFCVDLVTEPDICLGAMFISEDKCVVIRSKVTVLSTGGLGQLYEWTTNPVCATGDGIAIAARAGVEIQDLEFIQFHPTALRVGESPLFLLSEALRGEGAYIVNSSGMRFLFDTLPKGELAPRDEISRVIFAEMKKINVYLDMRHIKKDQLQKQFPNIYKTLLEKYNLDLSHDLIPITPAAHYSCGGVVTDLQGKTSMDNLYAVGEVTCTGVHGANRLASNSLLEAVVFGRLAGKSISAISSHPINSELDVEPSELTNEPIDDRLELILNVIRTELKQIMWEKVGIVRSKIKLLEAQDDIKALQTTFLSECDIVITKETLEIQNMLTVASLIIQAALSRPKSLGAHFLIDSK